MFESLTERLSKTLRDLRGMGRLNETNIKDVMIEVMSQTPPEWPMMMT